MPPDLGRQEQEPQTRRRQRRVPHRSYCCAFLAIEQLQPAVQVVGQHRDLKPVAVHHPAPGGMRRQPRIIVGFLDQVLGCSPLVVERHQRVHRPIHVRHKHPVDVLRRLEQLVLLRRIRRPSLPLLLITQRQEPIRFPPAIRLIPEFALSVGVGPLATAATLPLSTAPPDAPSCGPR